MRKQIAYDFRLLKVSATDPNATRAHLSEIVNGYLAEGWELLKVETVHYEANDAYSAYHFVRYAEEPVLTKSSGK